MRRMGMVLSLLLLGSCGGTREKILSEVIAFYQRELPGGPEASLWQKIPACEVPLLLQDLVEPRLLAPSTPRVRVQAVHDGARVAFRLSWEDASADQLPTVASFADACAVQFPKTPARDLPAPQMGEEGRGVEITYWRASWEAALKGGREEITALYPHAHPDHYPFAAPPLTQSPVAGEMSLRYAPARALGNPMEGPRERAVEDLFAEGPGTLQRAPRQFSQGRGMRTPTGWAVQLVRPLPEGVGVPGQGAVAFAVWEASRGEVGAKKMRSGWVSFRVRERS